MPPPLLRALPETNPRLESPGEGVRARSHAVAHLVHVLITLLCLYHPLLVHLHNLPMKGDLPVDWEDYNYLPDPGGGQQGDLENPLAALLAGIPDFSTEELEALLRDLPVPDDTRQPAAAGMTMAEAVDVSDTS